MPEELTAEQRQRLRLAHHRLRNASQAIEALVATEQIKGRWAPMFPPPEALKGAENELEQAYQAVAECQREMLHPALPGEAG